MVMKQIKEIKKIFIHDSEATFKIGVYQDTHSYPVLISGINDEADITNKTEEIPEEPREVGKKIENLMPEDPIEDSAEHQQLQPSSENENAGQKIDEKCDAVEDEPEDHENRPDPDQGRNADQKMAEASSITNKANEIIKCFQANMSKAEKYDYSSKFFRECMRCVGISEKMKSKKAKSNNRERQKDRESVVVLEKREQIENEEEEHQSPTKQINTSTLQATNNSS